MGRGGRFGKYGDQKRVKRLRQKRLSAFPPRISIKSLEKNIEKGKYPLGSKPALIQVPTDEEKRLWVPQWTYSGEIE